MSHYCEPEKRPITKLSVVAITMATIALTHLYLRSIELPGISERMSLQAEILAGTAESPYRYRLLIPFAAEGLRRSFNNFVGDQLAFVLAFVLLNFATISYYLYRLLILLQRWLPESTALTGSLLVAIAMPVTFQDHVYQPWSFLEAGLFCHACSATLDRRFRTILALTFASTLNRETGLFVAAVWAASTYSLQPKHQDISNARSVIPLVIWAGTYGVLRYLLGHADHVHGIRDLWALNTQPRDLIFSIVNLAVLLGPLWAFIPSGAREAPPDFRRLLLIIPVYTIFYVVFGRWPEVRILLTPLPLMIGAALLSLNPRDSSWR